MAVVESQKRIADCSRDLMSMQAANYLNIVDILKITCKKVADDIIGARCQRAGHLDALPMLVKIHAMLLGLQS